MSHLIKDILFSVARIKVEFIHKEFGDQKKTITGTGFWLEVGKNKIFVTNKHNVDTSLQNSIYADYKINRISIEIRKIDEKESGKLEFYPITKYFEVSNLHNSLRVHRTADCAILANPQFSNLDHQFRPRCMTQEEKILASVKDFEEMQELSLPGSFVGFPNNWYDRLWKLPIVRDLTIACYPGFSFINPEIKTSDVHLVSGLSFEGSSGSPVFIHGRGTRLNVGPGIQMQGTLFTPPYIIGIMSGHFRADNATPDVFKHSGLSYYTRSTAISELINQIEMPSI